MAVDPAGPDTVVAKAPAVNWKKWLPTKKWLIAAVSGASALVISALESGEFGNTEEAGLKTLAVALLLAYIKRNDPTPGGVQPAA